MPTLTELQDNLRIGLATISEQWNYKAKAKDWVTSVYAADIDDDGDIEIIAGSRDGRVHALTKEGNVRWRRIIGNKAWIGTLVSIAPPGKNHSAARIMVVTRVVYLY